MAGNTSTGSIAILFFLVLAFMTLATIALWVFCTICTTDFQMGGKDQYVPIRSLALKKNAKGKYNYHYLNLFPILNSAANLVKKAIRFTARSSVELNMLLLLKFIQLHQWQFQSSTFWEKLLVPKKTIELMNVLLFILFLSIHFKTSHL